MGSNAMRSDEALSRTTGGDRQPPAMTVRAGMIASKATTIHAQRAGSCSMSLGDGNVWLRS
jgi:hypothetical protein